VNACALEGSTRMKSNGYDTLILIAEVAVFAAATIFAAVG
jgi:hypothetical protein